MKTSVQHLLSLQHADGHWEGEMVWCTMILSQYVVVQHVAGREWDDDTRAGIVRHFEFNQNSDGSWGLHPESQGYVFTTTLAYVALRLLGLSAEHALTASARRWLYEDSDGVLANPTWGKFWLMLLDLYGRDGVHPLLPEIFLFPQALPFHPLRFYCHTRYIYIAIAYLSGCGFDANLGALRDELRTELYPQPFGKIDFAKYRDVIAETDLYVRPSRLLRWAYRALRWYDRFHAPRIRRKALDFCFHRIVYEQRATNYQGLSPVNAMLNCLALVAQDPQNPELSRSLAGLESWLWHDEHEGIRYAGASSNTWDTAFAMQALLANPGALDEVSRDSLRRAYAYLRDVQMTDDLPDRDRESRDSVLGGWCFSDGQHRWPVSDCTAEALCAILAWHDLRGLDMAGDERISDAHIVKAVTFLLDRQNEDGGFGTYERRRGPTWLERFNPSEMYGACMVEGSYLECTGSALCALAAFRRAYPQVMRYRIDHATKRAATFLIDKQRTDGSWPGFWGVNFTYAIFHCVKGMCATGLPSHHPSLQKAAAWLVEKQKADGGWGEHYSGCLTNAYVEHERSQPVMTAWSLLTLMEVLPVTHEAIVRGINWLESNQNADGSWTQDAVTGVFFGTAMLDYRLYKAYFPTWALAKYRAKIGR